MRTPLSFMLLAGFGVLVGCGGKTEEGQRDDGLPAGLPSAFYTPGDSTTPSCPVAAPVERARAGLARESSSDQYAVVAISFADECTNLGGQYILGQDLYRPTVGVQGKYFLGGHGCRSWTVGPGMNSGGPALPFGVVRFAPIDSIRAIPPGVCVGIDEGNRAKGLQSSGFVRGVALFATRVEAERFARELGWSAADL